MAGTLLQAPYSQFFDDNGDPLAGGLVTFYKAGTTTKTPAYTDEDLDTEADNPLELDAAGRMAVYLDPDQAYKIVVTDADGGSVRTQDNIQIGISSSSSAGTAVKRTLVALAF